MGVGIGSEYPACSTTCGGASALLPPGQRNRYFTLFTNFTIDLGFILSSFVPMILLWVFTPKRLTIIWRLSISLGAHPPISLFVLRLYYKEGENFQKTRFKKVSVPYGKIFKFYWFKLAVISTIWSIYDFSAYGFCVFSSYIIEELYHSSHLYKRFG